jgi:hypothetical protein
VSIVLCVPFLCSPSRRSIYFYWTNFIIYLFYFLFFDHIYEVLKFYNIDLWYQRSVPFSPMTRHIWRPPLWSHLLATTFSESIKTLECDPHASYV